MLPKTVLAIALCAVAAIAADDAAAIRTVMDAQVQAWNRGDIAAFMEGYEKSPETAFVGKAVVRGWQSVMDRYLDTYSNRDKMGTLEFSSIEVRPLDGQTAIVTGRFHLTRSEAGGGDARGIFTLVFCKTAAGWRIVHDHTSAAV